MVFDITEIIRGVVRIDVPIPIKTSALLQDIKIKLGRIFLYPQAGGVILHGPDAVFLNGIYRPRGVIGGAHVSNRKESVKAHRDFHEFQKPDPYKIPEGVYEWG